jgi:hypothetical protein
MGTLRDISEFSFDSSPFSLQQHLDDLIRLWNSSDVSLIEIIVIRATAPSIKIPFVYLNVNGNVIAKN